MESKPPIPRITLQKIGADLLAQLNLEKGLGYTIKQLSIAPKAIITEYLFENRNRSIKPLTFLLLTATLATFLTLKFIPAEKELLQDLIQDPDYQKFPDFLKRIFQLGILAINKYFNLLYISAVPAFALGTYAIFREKGWNFAEHLIINMYIFGYTTLLYLLATPFFLQNQVIVILQMILTAAYTYFAYVKIFDQRWLDGLWKSFVIWLIAQVLSSLLITILLLVLSFFIPLQNLQ